jgi:hypothetical protein
MQTNLIFINKKGMIEINSMKYIEKSNFNKMLVCPKCKENILDGFLMELSPNTKSKEKTVNPRLTMKTKFKGYFNPEEMLDDMVIPVVSHSSLTAHMAVNGEYTPSLNRDGSQLTRNTDTITFFNPENLPEGSL